MAPGVPRSSSEQFDQPSAAVGRRRTEVHITCPADRRTREVGNFAPALPRRFDPAFTLDPAPVFGDRAKGGGLNLRGCISQPKGIMRHRTDRLFPQGLPTRDAGESRRMVRLGLSPVIEHCGLAGFCTWPRRQIVWFIFNRARQERQIVFGCVLDPFDTSERVVEIIMQDRCLKLHICKIRLFCSLPKGLVEMDL